MIRLMRTMIALVDFAVIAAFALAATREAGPPARRREARRQERACRAPRPRVRPRRLERRRPAFG